MPNFIPVNGSTLHLVGICFNRIGMNGSSGRSMNIGELLQRCDSYSVE